MIYSTESDFTTQFGADELLHLTDRDRDGIADAGAFEQCAVNTAGLIDSYLMMRYAVPLAPPVPDVIRFIAGDIVRYFLWENAATEEVRQRYEDAIAWLRAVARGDIGLPLTTAVTDQRGFKYTSRPALFTPIRVVE